MEYWYRPLEIPEDRVESLKVYPGEAVNAYVEHSGPDSATFYFRVHDDGYIVTYTQDDELHVDESGDFIVESSEEEHSEPPPDMGLPLTHFLPPVTMHGSVFTSGYSTWRNNLLDYFPTIEEFNMERYRHGIWWPLAKVGALSGANDNEFTTQWKHCEALEGEGDPLEEAPPVEAYAVAKLGEPNTGSSMDIRANKIELYDADEGAVVASWVADEDSFTEAGLVKNWPVGEPLRLFWAEEGDNGYFFFPGPEASEETDYSDSIRYEGEEAWKVDIGGFEGYSYPGYTAADGLETGVELGEDGPGCVEAHQSDLERYNPEGDPESGWPGDTGLFASEPPYIEWEGSSLSENQSFYTCSFLDVSPFEDRVPIRGMASAVEGAPARVAETPVSPITQADVTSIAVAAASAAGDANPVSIEQVRSTRSSAVRSHPAIARRAPNPFIWWWCVGSSRPKLAPRPRDAPAPSGSVMTLVVSEATRQNHLPWHLQSRTRYQDARARYRRYHSWALTDGLLASFRRGSSNENVSGFRPSADGDRVC